MEEEGEKKKGRNEKRKKRKLVQLDILISHYKAC